MHASAILMAGIAMKLMIIVSLMEDDLVIEALKRDVVTMAMTLWLEIFLELVQSNAAVSNFVSPNDRSVVLPRLSFLL